MQRHIQSGGNGSGPPHSSLGTSPCLQSDVQPQLWDWDGVDLSDLEELNFDQFQDLTNNFVDCTSVINPNIFEESPTNGTISRDGSSLGWCDQLNETPFELNDNDFSFLSELSETPVDHDFHSSPFSQENILNQSLYGSSSVSHDYASDIDVISVDSEPQQNLKHIFQDIRLDFLSKTKIELESSDEHNTKKRKITLKKYQSPDEDYEVDDEEDDDDDDDYECYSTSKGSNRKHKKMSSRKRGSQYDYEGQDLGSKKKNQNKRAAMKYRDKKKKEDVDNEVMLQRLVSKNEELRRQKQEKEHELMVLKHLFQNLVKK